MMNQPIDRLPNSETFVQTPLVRFDFYANAIGGDVDNLSISQCSIDPQLPEGMRVDGCIAVLLQFTVAETIAEFNFENYWFDEKKLENCTSTIFELPNTIDCKISTTSYRLGSRPGGSRPNPNEENARN